MQAICKVLWTNFYLSSCPLPKHTINTIIIILNTIFVFSIYIWVPLHRALACVLFFFFHFFLLLMIMSSGIHQEKVQFSIEKNWIVPILYGRQCDWYNGSLGMTRFRPAPSQHSKVICQGNFRLQSASLHNTISHGCTFNLIIPYE